MKKLFFKKLDAFSSGRSSGNPAGYILIDKISGVTESEMQKIAYELKGFVSEVGYVSPSRSKGYDFSIRYFSCEKEVPFCGHATVAIMYDLIKNTGGLINRHVINIKTSKGVLQVENRIKEDDIVYIYAPEPAYPDCDLDHASIAEALNLSRENMDERKPPAIVNAGMNTLLVCLKGLKDCINCSPDYLRLREFALANDIEVITIYTHEVTNPGRNLRTRVFAPAFGYLEDPATGSGNAALGYHLMRTGKWLGNTMVIEQGPDLENPNIIKLGKTDSGRIKIGGRGIARIEGDYILQG